MFDHIKDALYCPFCGKKSDELSFQTKDTECMLDVWTIEDLVKFYPKKSIIEIHDECKYCKKWISLNLEIWRAGKK